MEEQYKKTFDQMVDSLKMYQRYELKDKNRKDILDKVYVDPIENDGILNLCLKDNTTVLIGRRGTGKSTIFMRMQNELRKQNDIMTCYIDVKSIFDVAKRNYITINYLKTSNLEEIEQDIIERDYRDMHREHSPLKQAEDAVLVDSSDMTIEEVIDAIIEIARRKGLNA